MKNTYRLVFPIFVLGMGVMLGGCIGLPSSKDYSVDESAIESPVKTLKGTVSVTEKSIFLSNDGVTTEITSHKIDLNKYEGQNIEVTGQFSGTVLYVDEVK